MANKPTPVPAPMGMNIACDVDMQCDEFEPKAGNFNVSTDDGLASRRSKTVIRNHAEMAAATGPAPPAGYGMALRQRMAGVGGNDQFPYRTDEYGKQRN